MGACKYPNLSNCYAVPVGFDFVHKAIASKSRPTLKQVVESTNKRFFMQWWQFVAIPAANAVLSQMPFQYRLEIWKACNLPLKPSLLAVGSVPDLAAIPNALDCPMPQDELVC